MNKKNFIKAVVLIVIFVATVLIVNRINNSGINNLAAEMEQPTLPLVYVKYEDKLINCMHGYTSDIDITLFRETITPIDKNKTVELWIDQSIQSFDNICYELRFIKDNSLVEEGIIEDIAEENGYKKAVVTFRMDVTIGQEYMLVIKLQEGDVKLAKYYTRVLYEKSMHTGILLNTVVDFNNNIFDGTNTSAVGSKLEPDPKGNNSDLSLIDIHSNYETVTWAGLSPMKITTAIPRIVEIDSNFACINMDYVIISNVEASKTYLVKERYRVRWVDEDTIYLVGYEREQEELFLTSNVDISNNRFRIGIVDDEEFKYITSDKENKVAFVQGGQLWYYNYSKSSIAKVFGFWQDIYTDARTMYNHHEIDIINMDDSGNILFDVYGYMNRGNHEGEMGIAIYRFDSANNRISELAFLASDLPYDMLEEYASKLIYMTGDKLYYTMNDSIYCMDVNTKEIEEIVYNVPNDVVAVSPNKNYVAYPNASTPEESTSITLLNLDTRETTIFDADVNAYIKPLGFVDGDLIYGKANSADIFTRKDGEVIFPMNSIYIVDANKSVVKEYSKTGGYVSDITVNGNVIYLNRIRRTVDDYEEIESDFISYKEDVSKKVSFTYKYSETYYNQYYMVFPSNIYVKTKPRLIITEESLFNEAKQLDLDSKKQKNRYYMYAAGKYQGSYSSSQKAIREAYDVSGLVTTNQGEIIWRKTTLDDYNSVAQKIGIYNVESAEDSLKACIYMMANYEGIAFDFSTMEGENGLDMITKYVGRTGVNMSGNLMDVGLYYLCNDVPFIVKYSDNTYVLVTSFNSSAVRYINPLESEDIRVDREEFEENMAAEGNVMYSYVPAYR